MQVRRHAGAGMSAQAVFSDCGRYRFRLTRRWGEGAALAFVMLNPSTADELRNDPTVARCEARARAAGFGAVEIVNLFAFRATDPRALTHAADPAGPGADGHILRAARAAAVTVCAWGNGGALGGRNAAVAALLRRARVPLWHLGLTARGAPCHPLYVPGARTPEPWPDA